MDQYFRFGIQEDRKPNPYFDPRYYRTAHADDALAQEDPLAHYVENARRPGHHPCPYFDNDWYADTYLADQPDVVPLAHFLTQGEANGHRPHPLFDEARYLELNRDVARWVAEDRLPSGYHHFVSWGADELERGHFRQFNFNWGSHALDYDPVAYRADNPDVGAVIAAGRLRNGLEHLFAVGWREAVDGLRAPYGPRHGVRLVKDVPGRAAKSGGRHLCLFAHYDPDGRVDPYVLIYLKALRSMEVDIVFITAADDARELAKVKPLVTRILIKNEAGRDFGSWVLALKTLGLDCGKDYERVILANDSIYFPVRPVAPLFEDMHAKGYNLYGLSDSRDLETYHLQSFFLAFDAKAQKAVFPEFVARFDRNYVLTKWGQIHEYELGLTKIAFEAGLSFGAYFSGDDAREDVIRDPRLKRWETMRGGLSHINPTHDLWDLMIGHYGWPGVKLELLRDNPRHANGLDRLPSLIKDGEVPMSVISAHQKRLTQPDPIVRAASGGAKSPPKVALIERIEGRGRSVADRLVLFAHYDPDGIIDPHIVYQVRELEKAGCAVAFITPVRNPIELAKVVPFARDVLVKTDAGRDFGSWSVALRALRRDLDGFGSVIWMNDSTYFPLFDPKPMFKEMSARQLDFWGIVDSYNVTWHIMSWFWAFGRKAISDGWFDWYLAEYNPAHTKWAQIHNYEMRLPRLIAGSGLQTGVYVAAKDLGAHIVDAYPDHPRIDAARRGDFSMTHDFWRESIVDFHSPALKVELVRDNPLGIDLSKLLAVIGERTNYDPELIRRHMLRLKTAHLPPPSWDNLGPEKERAS